MTDETPALDRLAAALGVWLSFQDPDSGQIVPASLKAKRALCAALGFPASSERAATASLKRLKMLEIADFAPPVLVVRQAETTPLTLELYVPKKDRNKTISFILTREDSTTQAGAFMLADEQILETLKTPAGVVLRCRVGLNLSVPMGYHDLSFLSGGVAPAGVNMRTRVIVVPDKCWCPPHLAAGGRAFGLPLQLYALKSRRNWGMGDLTDLKDFMRLASQWGAAYVGINPLNALFADAPEEASPYYVSSRLFLNPMYIDTDAVPEAAGLPTYDAYKHTARFKELVAYCRSSEKVEYAYVSEMKYTALGILFEAFRAVHLNPDETPKTARGQAFADFVAQKGRALNLFALWTVLRMSFAAENRPVAWQVWETGYQNPDSTQTQAFAARYRDSLLFVMYQQFLAFEQYRQAVTPAESDVPFPRIYTDMPVGVGADSADVWGNQTAFLAGLSVGAPPDLFNAAGQDWALAAFHPRVLKQQGYEPFIRVLREKMAFGGAVRLDHAFSLMRLFLRTPLGEGAYLSYPFTDLIGILALESERNACLVIAEDLGTPPPTFYDLMRAAGALSFRLFRYEKDGDRLKPPARYDRQCLIMTGSHDMPTMSAVWTGKDLILMRDLNLISDERYEREHRARIEERRMYLEAFTAQGLYVDWQGAGYFDTVPEWFMPHLYEYLARSNSMLILVRLEDVLMQTNQVNIPGTHFEYPNWRFKLPVSLDELALDERLKQVMEAVHRARP